MVLMAESREADSAILYINLRRYDTMMLNVRDDESKLLAVKKDQRGNIEGKVCGEE